MEKYLTVLFWILCGITCAFFAKKKERSPVLWFFVGLLGGVFGLIFLFFTPAKKKEAVIKPYAAPHVFSKISWYYLDAENKTCGPISEEKLQTALKEGKISLSTLIWNEEMEEWKKLGEASPFTTTLN